MPGLNILDLSQNRLTGTIPAMSNLPGLHTLYFSCNQLTGSVPASLNSLRNLRNLYLHDNLLSGFLPVLTNLGSLSRLYLSWISLKGDYSKVSFLLDRFPNTGSLTLALGGNLFEGVDRDTGAISNKPAWLHTRNQLPCSPRTSFDADSYSAIEGSAVTVTVNLVVEPAESLSIPVNATPQGGATDADYGGLPVILIFNSSDTKKSFTFTAISDGVIDDGESVILSFGTLPDNLTAGHPQTTTIYLLDNDATLQQTFVSFSAANHTAEEGGSPAAVAIELDVSAESTIEIPLVLTRNNGASPADYRGVPESVTFLPGDMSKTITVIAYDDGESLTLAFGSLPPGLSAGRLAQTTVNILDNDDKQPVTVQQDKVRDSSPAPVPAGNANPLVTVSFKTPLYTPTEGAGPVPVTLLLDREPGRTLSIPLNVSLVNGASPYDYSGLPSAITFNGGETEKTFYLTATDDDEDDDEEGLVLTFGELPQRVVAGNPDAATVYLFDNDLHLLQVSFGASNFTATEGGPSAHVTVKLNFSSRRTVTIPISVAHFGSAGPGDYSGIPESVTFYGGETRKSFIVTAANDGKDDDNESVALSFGALPADVSPLGPAAAVVNLIDNNAIEMLVSASLDTRTYLTMGTGNSSTDTLSFRENAASAPGIHVNSEIKRD